MKKMVTVTLTLALAGGFLVGDVLSLPRVSSPVEPSIERVALGGDGGVVLSAAAAGVLSRLTGVVDLGPGSEPGTQVIESVEIDTQEFSVAGVSWDTGSAPDPASVQLRVREDGQWTDWQAVAANDEGPDAGTAEYDAAVSVTATDPLVSFGADAVQVRLEIIGTDIPTGLDVVVIDPGVSEQDDTSSQSTPLTSADAAVAPAIVTRAAWGADESLRSCAPSYSPSIKAAVVHHTAGSNSYTAAQSAGIVRGIYAYHTRTLGWCDVGYNFLVDKYGQVFEGRAGGIARPVQGAHSGGFNASTFGVSAIGNYMEASAPPVMRDAIGGLIGWKLGLSGVSPTATTVLTSAGGGTSKYATGAQVSVPTVFGHRDVGSTLCPGTNLYSQLGSIRTTAQAVAGDASFVRAIYADMLSRVPAAAEVSHWVPYVGAPGGRGFVTGGFAASEEYRKKSITAAYVDVLGRQPDSGGLQGWYLAVVEGRTDVDDIRRVFLASEEFRRQAGGTDEGWVRLMYRRALQREAGAGEVTFWAGKLRTMGRAGVIDAVYDSQESARVRVDRAYRAWLGRSASTAERANWEVLVVAQGDEAMRGTLMVSEEYYQRALRR